ncbi:flagellar protein FlaG [Thermosipho ferrireducens]|uniref:Flagellar protein FlaG n=1 Tax=Thermosipho ferrireducens TaxID=2571116 RepID=A0ABX7S5J7_9BACT|nr:flagellar protein FlaG [Thermosipho ferrireducens]QTA37827.1 flagellar protein FlaG [Thermosipho ferrireducens]
MDGISKIDNSQIEIKQMENRVSNVKTVKPSEELQSANVDPKKAAENFKENLEKLKKLFRGEAEFKIDKETGIIVVKIKDKDSGEIIRQIPPEVALKLAKNIAELLGIIFDERA